MKDYFRPFLVQKNLAELDNLNTSDTINKYKTHVIWALAAGGVGFVCWKSGQWYATYKLLKKKLESA